MGLKRKVNLILKKKLRLKQALGECFLEKEMSGYIAECSHSAV